MRISGLKQFSDDLRAYINKHAEKRTPVPMYDMKGYTIHMPYTQADYNKFAALCQRVNDDDLAIDVTHINNGVSILTHSPYRRRGRQVS